MKIVNVTRTILCSDLRTLGITSGDTVFFHSSLKSIGHVEGGPDAVLDAFLDVIGPEGTLSLPALCLYDWDGLTSEQIEREWDVAARPTYTGLIPETFRLRRGVARSNNPTHSVTAFGKHADTIACEHRAAAGAEWAAGRPKWASRGAFGSATPWQKLYELDAKYLLIGVGFDRCTILHHVQALYLEARLRDTGERAPWPDFNFNQFGDRLERSGIVRKGTLGASTTRLMSTRNLVDTAVDVLASDGPERYRTPSPEVG